ncbi:MAG: RnfABCDGE type electron transport complex subunit G [Muribaculum sp.]|nr:RnfABCDGE type electron transport complex subunit G [Muribaculaceae bacterium]MCM1080527.1 RnfABCDGE type electron transport complex subunit G [Muribaculum sp.]
MKKLTSTLPNMVMSLGIITIVAAALLAWTNSVTAEPIAQAAKQKQINAIKSVAPKFDNDPLAQAWSYTPQGAEEPFTVFPAYEGDEFTGAAVEGYTMNGFSGEVRVMYGFAADGTITGYEVLSHSETPGLGAKMNEWFRSDAGNRSVIGRNPATADMHVSKDGGEVDAITAATISSRAFLDVLRESYNAFMAYNNENKN